MKKLSNIILAHKQEPNVIRATIESSVSQNYGNSETIVVNNSGKPLRPELRYLEDKAKFVDTADIPRGIARNYGVSKSDGDTIILTDADTIICGNNTFDKIANMSNTSSQGYGAQRHWTYPPEMFEENATEYINAIREEDVSWLLDETRSLLPKGIDRGSGYRDLEEFTFPGNFGFFNRELFERVGGFSDKFEGYGGEDDYLGFLCYLQDPEGFRHLHDLKVLHINHPIPDLQNKTWGGDMGNYSLVQSLIKEQGYTAFNLNLLFGVREWGDEKVLETEERWLPLDEK